MANELTNIDAEIAKLREFPVKVEANVIRGAVRAGAVVMKNAIAPLVPVLSGKLLGSLRVSTRIRKGEAIASVKVGNPKRGVFYDAMVIGGTKPHLIVGRAGPLVIFGIVRRSARHPGAKANPFMAKGNDQAGTRAVEAVFRYADDRIAGLLKDQGNAG